jgi:hypothetical protein
MTGRAGVGIRRRSPRSGAGPRGKSGRPAHRSGDGVDPRQHCLPRPRCVPIHSSVGRGRSPGTPTRCRRAAPRPCLKAMPAWHLFCGATRSCPRAPS